MDTKQDLQGRKSNTIQQKIKKMMKEKKQRKTIKQSQSLSSNQRRNHISSEINLQNYRQNSFKQVLDDQQQSVNINKSWKKRNTSSQKYRDTQKSQTTTETSGTNKNSPKIDIQKIISNIFTHSYKLSQYCQTNRLQKTQTVRQLSNCDLFKSSLSSKLTKLNNSSANDQPEDLNQIVENDIIMKLNRQNRRKKQSISCTNVEDRIKKLINFRLQTLKKY